MEVYNHIWYTDWDLVDYSYYVTIDFRLKEGDRCTNKIVCVFLSQSVFQDKD